MTVKITALYTNPADPKAFEAHYLLVHCPLVDRMPGLIRQESARSLGTPDGGPVPYYRTAELYFEDIAALEAGFGSDAGRVAARDADDLIARTGCTLTIMINQLD